MDLRQRPVSEIMRREVVTLTAVETLDLTQDLMNLGRVRHLPVLDDGGRVVGIVSQHDLFAAALTKVLDFEPASRRGFLRSVQVGEVMAKDVLTASPDTTLGEVARIFVQRKIGCLPVVAPGGALLGLVTETDLLSAAFMDEERGEETGRTIDVSANSDVKGWLKRELEDVRRMRDELRVQAHLGKAEVHERWETLERALDTLEGKAKRASRAAEEPLHQLEQDARKLVKDLREGYRQIRDAI